MAVQLLPTVHSSLLSKSYNYNYIHYNKNIEVSSALKRKKDVFLIYVTSFGFLLEARYTIFFNYWFLFLLRYVSFGMHLLVAITVLNLFINIIQKFFWFFFSLNILQLQNFNRSWFGFLILIGLGFKLFFYKSCLFFRLGFCRIATAEVPSVISFVLRKKDRVFFSSTNKVVLGNFLAYLRHFKVFNIYKAKGFFNLFDFTIIPVKKGKQQQLF